MYISAIIAKEGPSFPGKSHGRQEEVSGEEVDGMSAGHLGGLSRLRKAAVSLNRCADELRDSQLAYFP
jgi:hypothetical protein